MEKCPNGVIYAAPSVAGDAEKNAELIHERLFSVVRKSRPSSVLEIGSGRGRLGARFVEEGIRYIGIEPIEAELEEARRHFPSVRFLHASCYDDTEELMLGKFDLVYSNDVVEHLYEPRRLVDFSKAHLNPGGRIVCGTPHYGSYFRNLLFSITNRWDHHHNPLWDGGHIKFFSKATLQQIWEEAGFVDFIWGSISSRRLPIVPMYLYCTATLGAARD